jgi:hypothetical protein
MLCFDYFCGYWDVVCRIGLVFSFLHERRLRLITLLGSVELGVV